MKMSGFVCLTFFIIGYEFREAHATDLDFSVDRKFQGDSSISGDLSINDDFSESERNARGRSPSTQRLFLSLFFAFIISGTSSGVLMIVKFLLLKGAFLLMSTLIVTGFIFGMNLTKKSVLLLLPPHYDLFPVKNNQYPEYEPDFSGFGYKD